MAKKGLALHNKVFIGLIAGAAAGVAANAFFGGAAWLGWTVDKITQPAGQIFLRLLFMVVIPLIFASLSLGVAQLGDLRKLGRIGLKTLAYFALVTALATTIGLSLVNLIRPGAGVSAEVRDQLIGAYAGQAQSAVAQVAGFKLGVEMIVNLVPRNPVAAAAQGDMLAWIVFSLIFGLAVGLLPRERAAPMLGFLQALADAVVVIIDLVMKLAPYGVAALLFSVTARFGYDLLQKLLWYVLTVLIGLAIHQFGVYSLLVKFLGGMSPRFFFARAKMVMLTAFSTSSSNATLPTTMRVSENELGLPREVGGFVLPLGATMNMNGTALFEGVTVLFLAQVFGIELNLAAQGIVVLLSVVTAIGTAGVPSGSIPLLVLVLQAVGVPGEGIALILGVDRLLDMCRTTLNVTGDLTAAAFIARSEGYSLKAAHVPAR